VCYILCSCNCYNFSDRIRFRKTELWVLVHSLQQHLGVVVAPPKKRPKESVNFVSYDGVGETECRDDGSVVEDVDGGDGSADETDSAGELMTDDGAVGVDAGVRGDDDNLGEVEGGEVNGGAENVEGGSGARADETDRSGEMMTDMMTDDGAVGAGRKLGSTTITDYFRPLRQPRMTPEPEVTEEAILHHVMEARRCEVGASKRIMRTEDLFSLRRDEFLTDCVRVWFITVYAIYKCTLKQQFFNNIFWIKNCLTLYVSLILGALEGVVTRKAFRFSALHCNLAASAPVQ
jgi:hypothetical protein